MDISSITYYSISPRVLNLLAAVHQQLGEVQARHLSVPPQGTAKTYRVSAVQATLAIEGSALDHRPIAELAGDHGGSTRGPEALEAVNTHRVYDQLTALNPFVDQDLRQAHAILMHGLAVDAGHYRTGPIGVFYGEPEPLRTAPAKGLSMAVQELLQFAEEDDFPPLLTSCVLHFGLIHLRPFIAGNGRLARLWQRAMLTRHWTVFNYLPVEAFIKRTEPAYNAALEYADRRGDCEGFVVYLLERIHEALIELLANSDPYRTSQDRVIIFKHHQLHKERHTSAFGRKDYLAHFPKLSTATATRDLRDAVANQVLQVNGSGRSAKYEWA